MMRLNLKWPFGYLIGNIIRLDRELADHPFMCFIVMPVMLLKGQKI
ncbi:MAG: hypothetical protein WCP85_21385 [Mariniphaga sp.]